MSTPESLLVKDVCVAIKHSETLGCHLTYYELEMFAVGFHCRKLSLMVRNSLFAVNMSLLNRP